MALAGVGALAHPENMPPPGEGPFTFEEAGEVAGEMLSEGFLGVDLVGRPVRLLFLAVLLDPDGKPVSLLPPVLHTCPPCPHCSGT